MSALKMGDEVQNAQDQISTTEERSLTETSIGESKIEQPKNSNPARQQGGIEDMNVNTNASHSSSDEIQAHQETIRSEEDLEKTCRLMKQPYDVKCCILEHLDVYSWPALFRYLPNARASFRNIHQKHAFACLMNRFELEYIAVFGRFPHSSPLLTTWSSGDAERLRQAVAACKADDEDLLESSQRCHNATIIVRLEPRLSGEWTSEMTQKHLDLYWQTKHRNAVSGGIGLFHLLQEVEDQYSQLARLVVKRWAEVHSAAGVDPKTSPMLAWARDHLYPILLVMWTLALPRKSHELGPPHKTIEDRLGQLAEKEANMVKDLAELMGRMKQLAVRAKRLSEASEGGDNLPKIDLNME